MLKWGHCWRYQNTKHTLLSVQYRHVAAHMNTKQYAQTPKSLQEVRGNTEEVRGDNNNVQCKRKVEPVEHDNAVTPPCPRMEYGIELKAERIVLSRSRGCTWDWQITTAAGLLVFVFPSWTSVDAHSTPSAIMEWGNPGKQRSFLGDPSLCTTHKVQQQVRGLMPNKLKQH